MDIWLIGTLNQLFLRGLCTRIKFLKNKVLGAKPRSLRYVRFLLFILFVLTLAFDWAVLYGNLALSVIVLSTKKK